MTEEELSTKLDQLIISRKEQLQDINKDAAKRINDLNIPDRAKELIKEELKLKAIEFKQTEVSRLQDIESFFKSDLDRIAEIEDISEDQYQINVNHAQESFLAAIENNQNEMISFRSEYVNFNLLARESFYNVPINHNETVAKASDGTAVVTALDIIIGESKIPFDPHGDSNV